MPAPYSVELRTRVVHAYERAEGTFEKLAELFEIGVATVNRWWSRFKKTRSVEPVPHGGGQPARVNEKGLGTLKAWLDERPDLTIEELMAMYAKRFRVSVSSSAMSRTLLRAGLTRKKRRSMQRRLTPSG